MIGCNKLFISYASLPEGSATSWIDEIYMKDIVQALASKEQILPHKCKLEDGTNSSRFVMVEAKASSLVSKEGFTVYLEYLPSKTNRGKHGGAEPGVLTIHWNSELRSFREKPDIVAFTPNRRGATIEKPGIGFFKHKDLAKPEAATETPTAQAMSDKMKSLLGKIIVILDGRVALKSCITYSQLAEDLGGYAPDSKYIAMCLGMLQKEDTKRGNPLRSALVVRKDTGRPGEGFYECAEEQGHCFKDNDKFWRGQIKKLVGDMVTMPI